jgi:hypothetical protein
LLGWRPLVGVGSFDLVHCVAAILLLLVIVLTHVVVLGALLLEAAHVLGGVPLCVLLSHKILRLEAAATRVHPTHWWGIAHHVAGVEGRSGNWIEHSGWLKYVAWVGIERGCVCTRLELCHFGAHQGRVVGFLLHAWLVLTPWIWVRLRASGR